MTPAEASALIRAVATWVEARPDLKALAVAGSRARGAERPDSDLDLLILADEPGRYRASHAWLPEMPLAPPFQLASHRGAAYGAVWSYHVLLVPSAELELAFAAAEWASNNPIDAGTRRVVEDGFKIIVDKDGLLQRLVAAIKPPSSLY